MVHHRLRYAVEVLSRGEPEVVCQVEVDQFAVHPQYNVEALVRVVELRLDLV